MSQIRGIAIRPGRTSQTALGVEPVVSAPHVASRYRPLLELDDLDACSEWHQGREALLAFVDELNLPGAEPDSRGHRYAQWLYAGMLISVELGYGTPVVAIENDDCRMVYRLADIQITQLRAATRVTSSSD